MPSGPIVTAVQEPSLYVPAPFQLDEPEAIARLIEGYEFALLVTAADGRPSATHLPFLYDRDRGARGTLLAHMARANPQWQGFARLAAQDGEALVVFSGPHAYVSPGWYAGGPAVPTWNYAAVHAYGRPEVIAEPARVRALIERLVAHHEAPRAAPWRLASQDESYLEKMLRGIVAFEIPVERIEAKAKMSQNRSAEDRAGVIEALAGEAGADAAAVAAMMRVSG